MAAVCMALNYKDFKTSFLVIRASEASKNNDRITFPEHGRNSRVLILGGTGAVGSNTALELSKLRPDLHIIIGGRNRCKGARMVKKFGNSSEFCHADIEDLKSLESAMRDVNLVVHTAGPFQGADCNVLKVAIDSKIAYIDICDDFDYALRAKSFKNKAIAAGVPAIITAGIDPGLSNVIAASLVHTAQTENRGEPEWLRFSYHVAGFGGSGPATIASTFYCLGEEVVTYAKGAKIKSKSFSGVLNIDFGGGVGKKNVFLLNMPEVRSAHDILGVPTVSARFGAEPFFWNWIMEAMTYVPNEFLRHRSLVQLVAHMSTPFTRAIDLVSRKIYSIRVDLECSDGSKMVAILNHRQFVEATGAATAAFVVAMLEGSTKPGVWFPDEPEGIATEARERLVKRAVRGATNFTLSL